MGRIPMAKTHIQNQAPAVEAGEIPKIFLKLIKVTPTRVKGKVIDQSEYDKILVGGTPITQYYDEETILAVVKATSKVHVIVMGSDGGVWIDEFEIAAEEGGQE